MLSLKVRSRIIDLKFLRQTVHPKPITPLQNTNPQESCWQFEWREKFTAQLGVSLYFQMPVNTSKQHQNSYTLSTDDARDWTNGRLMSVRFVSFDRTWCSTLILPLLLTHRPFISLTHTYTHLRHHADRCLHRQHSSRLATNCITFKLKWRIKLEAWQFFCDSLSQGSS